MSNTSRQILRYSLVFLFLWFGWQQIFEPAVWLGFLPEWTGYLPVPGEILVQANGWFGIMAAIFLAAGVFTRPTALILSLHLFVIAAEVGGAIGVRDSVLALASLALAASEPDSWTVDSRCRRLERPADAT